MRSSLSIKIEFKKIPKYIQYLQRHLSSHMVDIVARVIIYHVRNIEKIHWNSVNLTWILFFLIGYNNSYLITDTFHVVVLRVFRLSKIRLDALVLCLQKKDKGVNVKKLNTRILLEKYSNTMWHWGQRILNTAASSPHPRCPTFF